MCVFAANTPPRIEGTPVSASTVHNLFDLDNTYATKLDLTKGNTEKVARLIQMEVLLLDEVSMLDRDIFHSIATILNLCDHTRKGYIDNNIDEFGDCHVILFGDFKCPRPYHSPPLISKGSLTASNGAGGCSDGCGA